MDPESGQHVTSSIGSPQGSVLSPLLANIVLHELDSYMEVASAKFSSGKTRARNKAYDAITSKIKNVEKYKHDLKLIKALAAQRRRLPSLLPIDPKFKRLMYLRYADDFILLITGSHDDTTKVKN